MKKNDMDIILSRIERLSVFIEGNTLEGFQREILRVENKSFVYKLTSTKELTVYKPNGKNIFVLRDDLNDWIRRNPCFSYEEIDKQANVMSYRLENNNKRKRRTKRDGNGKI